MTHTTALTPVLAGHIAAVNAFDENAIVATDPKTLDAFFDTTTWAGAVRNAQDTWYAGWTCNSGTASFGTGNSGLCSSLPLT